MRLKLSEVSGFTIHINRAFETDAYVRGMIFCVGAAKHRNNGCYLMHQLQ